MSCNTACNWSELAARQGGVITSAQLLTAGVGRGTVRSWLAAGIFKRVARGVYMVTGETGGWPTELWVALLSSGPAAFSCRRSAAELWGLDGIERGLVEVAVGPAHRSRRAGTTRMSTIRSVDVVRLGGVPVTSAARTLFDLGAVCSADAVENALECALRTRLVALDQLSEQASCKAKTPGHSVLAAVLERRPAEAPPTESYAETLFVQFVRSIGLPDPSRQHQVILRGKKYRLDFAWPLIRLAIEIDGAAVHAGPAALAYDLRRQNQIVLDGWTILRFTWSMVAHDGSGVRREVTRAWQVCSLRAAL